jgi:hypothetical protein
MNGFAAAVANQEEELLGAFSVLSGGDSSCCSLWLTGSSQGVVNEI